MKPCDWDSRPLYEQLIEPLREKARALGYALAVHGTLKRDIDLVACPWTDEAVPAHELAEALLLVTAEVHGLAFMTPAEGNDRYHRAGCPGNKPHGRLTWCWHLGGGPYVDLSVMPRTDPAHRTWVMRTDALGVQMDLFRDYDQPELERQFWQIGTTHAFPGLKRPEIDVQGDPPTWVVLHDETPDAGGPEIASA